MISASRYKIIADLIDNAQTSGASVNGHLSNMTTTLSESEMSSDSIDRQRLEDQIDATSGTMTSRHTLYTTYVVDFVKVLQKYIVDNYSSIDDFLSDNNTQVKSVFADISEHVGYPIDAANVE